MPAAAFATGALLPAGPPAAERLRLSWARRCVERRESSAAPSRPAPPATRPVSASARGAASRPAGKGVQEVGSAESALLSAAAHSRGGVGTVLRVRCSVPCRLRWHSTQASSRHGKQTPRKQTPRRRVGIAPTHLPRAAAPPAGRSSPPSRRSLRCQRKRLLCLLRPPPPAPLRPPPRSPQATAVQAAVHAALDCQLLRGPAGRPRVVGTKGRFGRRPGWLAPSTGGCVGLQ